ncbi:MAG TPA: hypothetical protein VF815_36655 [Myxococcaceae bacterium]|jgi:hypothetical protein
MSLLRSSLAPFVLPSLLLTASPALAASPEGTCEVKVDGAVKKSFSGKGGTTAVATDHWYTKAELRDALLKIEAMGAANPSDKAKAKVDQMMKEGAQMMGPLVLNCVDPQSMSAGNLNILPGSKNSMERIPMKPGKVKLVDHEPKPGELVVKLAIGEDTFVLTKPGELVLTRFDGTGITGTFRYEAKKFVPIYEPQGPEQKVTVTGSFDFPCPYKTEVCRNAKR